MLMTLLSLAISFVSVGSLCPLSQQATGSPQTQSHRVQQENKDFANSTFVLNLPMTVSVNPIPLPSGDNAWAVQIVSSGGFTGSGRGNVTLTSDGILIRFGPDGSCSRKLPDETMQALTKTVFAANATSNTDGLLSRLICPDCIATAMVVTRRRIAGDETTYAASWDDASQAKVAADMMNIYQAVMANKACNLQ